MVNDKIIQELNKCEVLNGYAFKSAKYVKEGIRVIRITNGLKELRGML